ncbi:MAG: DUF2007 domain-containing protein [Porticoccaceae bacterium]
MTTTDKREAETKAALLRRHGIAAFLSDSHTRSLAGSAAFRGYQQSVWVALEEQFSDAQALMENPNYKVKTALSESELEDVERHAEKAMSAALLSLGGWIIGALAVAGVVAYVLVGAYNT